MQYRDKQILIKGHQVTLVIKDVYKGVQLNNSLLIPSVKILNMLKIQDITIHITFTTKK